MIHRREFIIGAGGCILSAMMGGDGRRTVMAGQLDTTLKEKKSKVSLVKTSDMASGISRAIDLLEINPVQGKDVLLKPTLILLDGIKAFVDGGPATGTKKRGDVILAGTDRIAIDAVGLAILKDLGSNRAIMGKKIFEQEQIARAVELGLGVSRLEDIEILADDEDCKRYRERLLNILMKG